jgi:hypothetical protein
VEPSAHLAFVEWRNELFERCDPVTGERFDGTQRHARPTRMK